MQKKLGLCETENGTQIDKPEQVGTKEYGKLLKRIQILEDSRVLVTEAKNWKSEGKRREYKKELLEKVKESVERAREKMLQDRGALPNEEGDIVREYKAMHEEHFLSSWLREDVEGRKDREEKAREEESRNGKRKVGREEEKAVVVTRRCRPCFR